jgi:UV DNA damage endonuclease
MKLKIGYPCINRSIGCTANSTFRLKSYSEKRMIESIKNNLECLQKILEFNKKKNLLFFRISSDLIPFASHPICEFDWQGVFKKDFKKVGNYIKKNNFRISMHPDQFIVLNSNKEKVVERSIRELEYHYNLLDLMELDKTAKIQLHMGGVYGNKKRSVERFAKNYRKLETLLKERLCIENDDKSYTLADCLELNRIIGIPVIFDTFHHECLNNGESIKEGIKLSQKTWKKKDGILMLDYSNQEKGQKKGKHIETIDESLFREFLTENRGIDF